MRHIISILLLCGSLMLVWVYSNHSLSKASADTTTDLITSVDTAELFSLLGHQKNPPTKITVSDLGVMYDFGQPKDTTVYRVRIGVWKTLEQAQSIYFRSSVFPVAPTISSTHRVADGNNLKIPGNQFAFWQSKQGDGLSGTLLMRRDNCVLDIIVHGNAAEVISLANKIDEALQRKGKLTQRGSEVQIPAITMSVPDMVPVRSTCQITVQSPKGSPIRINNGGDSNELVEEGMISCPPYDSVGPHEFTITMATAGNVIFSNAVTVISVRTRNAR